MKNFFCNLKFRYQLLISMITITTLALFFIVQISYVYFYYRNISEVKQKAGSSVQRAVSSLDSKFQNLSDSTNLLLVKAPFPQMILDINHNKFHGYAKYFSQAAEEANSFLHNHDLINNVILWGENDIFFSPSSLGISENVKRMFSENVWDEPSVMVFPCRPNFMFKQGSAIPISFPISCNAASGSISYQDMPETKRVRLILLMDSAHIRSYFDQMSNAYTYCMYLTDKHGFPLDITREQYPELFLPEFQSAIAQAEGTEELEITVENEHYLLSLSQVPFCGLKAVHITKKSALTGDVKTLQTFFIVSWLVCLILATGLSLSLSNFLTRGIKNLSSIIAQINHNDYKEKLHFQNSDEISLLGRQLNHMYDTIQKQLAQIKEEEQKKAQAQIQMLSEQINPHFLYNTLECIHFQILNQHSDTAGEMLESLGRYLRITLSIGNAMIPIEKEVEHVTSYMEIMNRHSSAGIRFSCHIESALSDHKVMKLLLQPLVENCIKHGFHGSVIHFEPVPPQITVVIALTRDEKIRIEVSDNGKGIDIPKAVSCLTHGSDNAQKHFGLHNIYQRLQTCYQGQAEISFSSIPYLKNSVIIEFPRDIPPGSVSGC